MLNVLLGVFAPFRLFAAVVQGSSGERKSRGAGIGNLYSFLRQKVRSSEVGGGPGTALPVSCWK